jgi:Cof subfamily protein (haloacid dehalogenase superfamily)
MTSPSVPAPVDLGPTAPRRFRLVLLDLDGTLLTSQRTIRDENVAALKRIMNAGVRVAFCTGRMPRSAQRYLDVVEPNAPSIHFNGAMVRDAKTGRIVFARTLTSRVALAALSAGDEHMMHANVYVNDAIWIERRSAAQLQSEEKDGVAHTLVDAMRVRLADAAPTKIMLIAPSSSIAALTTSVSAAVGSEAELVNSEPEYLEVLPPSCSKKSAAEALCAHLEIENGLADVIAFGDNLNDLALLESCGLGVAMQNSHADVLARVKAHVGDCDSDAIARYLDGFDVDDGALVSR